MYQEAIHIQFFDSPIGRMLAGSVKGRISLLEFAENIQQADQLAILREKYDLVPTMEEEQVLKSLGRQLQSYFDGTLQSFNIPIHYIGTDFQKAVWEAVRRIPFGQTMTYGEVSIKVEYVNAVRAVAQANGANHILILVPCHRVIGENGKLTGFSAGVDRKRWLLDHEKQIVSNQTSLF